MYGNRHKYLKLFCQQYASFGCILAPIDIVSIASMHYMLAYILEKRSLNNADAVKNIFDKRPNAADLQMIEF